MKFLKITAGVLTASMMLTGCTTTKNILSKRNNGSLDYRNEKKTGAYSAASTTTSCRIYTSVSYTKFGEPVARFYE
ncbi:hypothetical protein E9O_05376 [Moraxella catarrhalis 12P80B1]|nr:hypothetical protein E9O_05376 [Moraxella catarrhalis 12P80B1]